MRYYADETYTFDEFAKLVLAEQDGPSDPYSPQAAAEHAASLTPASEDREKCRKAVFRDKALTSMLETVDRLRGPEQTGVAYVYGFLKTATEETSLQTRLIKIGAKVVRHARAITFQLAEVAVSGDLFQRILAAIHGLRAPPAPT